MKIFEEVRQAEARIRSHVRETPLEYSPLFSEVSGAEVYLKLENLQVTGSFKVRGALNRLLTLSGEERRRGCVAASTGNHGAGMAHAMRELGVPGVIFVPEGASPSRVEAIRRLGAEVEFFGKDPLQAEIHARRHAEGNGQVYVSPYNDAAVIAGQGTIGVEVARQLESIDAVFVALGGGGLLSGVGAFLKSLHPEVRVIGCSPAHSPVMFESIRAGRIVELEFRPTLSDATAGGVEPGAMTFERCRQLMDDHVLVSEDEIRNAMRKFIEAHHMLLEGAAGVALQGLLRQRDRYTGKRAVVVICGANISLDTLRSVL